MSERKALCSKVVHRFKTNATACRDYFENPRIHIYLKNKLQNGGKIEIITDPGSHFVYFISKWLRKKYS
jgi:hypothetical protein